MKLKIKIIYSLCFGLLIALSFGNVNINYPFASFISVGGLSVGTFLGIIIMEKIKENYIKNKKKDENINKDKTGDN